MDYRNNNKINIHMLCATIRPDTFIGNHQRWIKAAKNKVRVKTIVAVNTEAEKRIIEEYDNTIEFRVCGDSMGICKPLYEITKNLELEDNEIIIVVCDDVNCIPCWDVYVANLMTNYKKAIFINDGLQNIDNTVNPPITMPLMNYKVLKSLNKIIYHPTYNHYYADNELYHNLKELGLLIDKRKDSLIFQHEHYDIGLRERDAIDNMVVDNCGYRDALIYTNRMAKSVYERLKI